jgi:ATP-dependent Lon protease
VSLEQKVELLETLDLTERLGKVIAWAKETLADLELKAKVRAEVAENLEQHQREAILRQQMTAIRKELGEDEGALVDDYRAKLADRELPEHVHTAVTAEIDKLERTPEQAAEHGWIRTWLDTVLDVPWDVRAEERLDLSAARTQLDADHTGLDKVKDRLIEHLAVRKLRAEREGGPDVGEPGRGRPATGAILALAGPPGVGKTSLGQSIAEATGRPYVRVSLGGVRDEAEIRGHRRTYVGARPGRIVKAIEEAGAMNPVMVLDEIDKVGADWRGDPSAALLEVLDPAQNSTFRDHYLELDLDLSDVLFIATANVLDTIPAPLLDRLEVIQLDGYTLAEKVDIARDHLVRRQREAAGLHDDEVDVSDDALRAIIEGHTREPGVRNLERKLAEIMRKLAARVAGDDGRDGDTDADADDRRDGDGEAHTVRIDTDQVREHLGRPRHRVDEERPRGVPGVATGLAVTGAGGDVLLVEVARVDQARDSGTDGSDDAVDRPAAGALELTGQLGDVMQESGRIALSFLRSNPEVLTARAASAEDPVRAVHAGRFHVHFPAGAIPKDGPSAGVTMTTALVSALTGRPMRHEVAMTGEVSLHGRVLPIGGVKQKLLAAHRAGITEVILPAANEADLDDVPAEVLEQLQVHLAEDVRTVLDLALEPAVAN